jgi:hypothetical protein
MSPRKILWLNPDELNSRKPPHEGGFKTANQEPDLSTPNAVRAYWNDQAKNRLLGRKIIGVRYMTEEERESMGWESSPAVLMLDDHSIWFPSRDDEGNGAGSLFGQSANNEDIGLPVIS